MSHHQYGKSANRGECLHACRRSYKITDLETGDEMELQNKYVMSPKDLCTIEIVDKLIEAGITAFKIEGRNRSPEYVKVVTESYKDAINAYFEKKFSLELAKELKNKLKTVYNRGFTKGYYLKTPSLTDSYGSKATQKKEFVGTIKNFYKKISVAEVKINTGELKTGDKILIIGSTTGVFETVIESMQIDHKEVKVAGKGQPVALMLKKEVRAGDKVYLLREI